MKVKLISAFLVGIGAIASSLQPAAAVKYGANSVYKATENGITTIYIDGTAGNKVAVDLGQLTKTTSKLAAACGDVRISIPKGNPNFTGLMVDGTAIDYASLPVQTLPTCTNGTFSEARTANFKTAKGQVVIVGKTPNNSVSISVAAESLRNLAIDTVVPSAFIVGGLAYPTSGTPGQAIYCKKGILYVSYPPPTPISPVDAATWTQSNPLPQTFSSNTIVISSSGSSGSNQSGSTTSGGRTTTTGGGTSSSVGGSTTSSGGRTTSGGGGTTSSGGGTTSSGGGTTSGGGGTTSSGGGTTNSKPQPPAGQKMCKVGTQLVSILPKKNVKYYAATEEDQSYEEENSDSTGYTIFNNINFTDTSNNGGLSDIEIGEIDLTKPSWANRKPLGSAYTVNISVVQPCK